MLIVHCVTRSTEKSSLEHNLIGRLFSKGAFTAHDVKRLNCSGQL